MINSVVFPHTFFFLMQKLTQRIVLLVVSPVESTPGRVVGLGPGLPPSGHLLTSPRSKQSKAFPATVNGSGSRDLLGRSSGNCERLKRGE